MSRLRKSTFGRAVNILSRADQRKIFAITVLQISMGCLDLLGVIAVGLLGALSVNGLQSSNPQSRVSEALEILKIHEATFQTQAIILGVSAMFLLVGRTILSIVFTRRTLFFLSRRGAKISSELVSKLLSQPLLVVQSRTTQETVYAVSTGVERIVLQVLGTAVVWIADLALLCVMLGGLLVIDPVTAFSTFLAFSTVGYLLYKFMHIHAGYLGVKNSRLSIKSSEKIIEALSSYRESVVRNRRDYYSREIGIFRNSLADTTAELAFIPYVSKYVIESTVVVGAILIGAAQFFFQDGSEAVGTLAIFLAAGTRIAPAVLRMQQGIINIVSGLGVASPTLDLIETLGDASIIKKSDDKLDVIHEGFNSEIELKEVCFTYPNRNMPAIANVSFAIPAGSSIAIVGPSGAGKTTLADVLLGVLIPDRGSVLVSGLPPLKAVSKWPGAVSYVPQDVVISDGTIRQNVALGYPLEEATDELVMSAIRKAHLDDFVAGLPEGIESQVGERGARISGGQRQRLGVARALFTHPKLLVLDEATSSLDGETEARISEAIQALRGSTTVIIIAHRLSTVKNVDKVIYLSNGSVLAAGTFEEVRNSVPDFDLQAKFMGL
jgi:ABC-type multidrug transport system fused ATPase/permease subunit